MEKPTIDSQVLSVSFAELQNVANTLNPVLIPLSAEEIKELDKLGNVSYSFGIKALEYARQIPALVPAYQDMNYIMIAYQNLTLLRQMEALTEQLNNNISTSRIKFGSIIKNFSKDVYEMSKMAAKQNIPGAKEAEQELGELYRKNGLRKREEDELPNDEIKL